MVFVRPLPVKRDRGIHIQRCLQTTFETTFATKGWVRKSGREQLILYKCDFI